MSGVRFLQRGLVFLLFARTVTCVTMTHAEPGALAFRADGLTGFGRDLVVAWSEAGELQVLTLDGKTQGQCRLPLQQLDQLVANGSEIYVAGSVDPSTRAALRIDTSCHVLDRWSLSGGWAELATDARGIVAVTSEGTAELRSGGHLAPVVAYLRRGPERRPAPSALYWLSFEGTAVLCRKRDLSMRGNSPGWCALQRPDGWVATGEWDAAVACGGYIIVRAGVDAKRVRWDALRLDSGQKAGSVALPRGAYRCAGEHFVVADGSRLKFLDPRSLKASSTLSVTSPVEQIEVVSKAVVYTSGNGTVVRSVAQKRD